MLGDDAGDGARVHKPTIIEELPDNDRDKPAAIPHKPADPARSRTGQRARANGEAGADPRAARRAKTAALIPSPRLSETASAMIPNVSNSED